MRRIVVVGASLAGLRAVETLREEGFGELTLAERHLPYDRPPLTPAWGWKRTASLCARKGMMRCDWTFGLRRGRPALRPQAVDLSDSSSVLYDGLVMTGSGARRLPGVPESMGVRGGRHALRFARCGRGPRASSGQGSSAPRWRRPCSLGLQVTVGPQPVPLMRALGRGWGGARRSSANTASI
jgi:NAD(P)H-nitrite reductase large subunit